MAINEAIEDAKGLAHWLGTQVHELAIGHGRQGQLAAASLGVALDHHVGVIVLLEHGCFASSVALLRPQVDACVRGAWLAYCATDEEVEAFETGKGYPQPAEMFMKVEEVFQLGILAQVKAGAWKTLCDYTHTGILQLQRNMTAGAVERNYPEDELIEALEGANAWAMWAATIMAELANNRDLGERLIERASEMTTEAPPSLAGKPEGNAALG